MLDENIGFLIEDKKKARNQMTMEMSRMQAPSSDLKKFFRGCPSSSILPRTTPRMTANMTNPRIFIPSDVTFSGISCNLARSSTIGNQRSFDTLRVPYALPLFSCITTSALRIFVSLPVPFLNCVQYLVYDKKYTSKTKLL